MTAWHFFLECQRLIGREHMQHHVATSRESASLSVFFFSTPPFSCGHSEHYELRISELFRKLLVYTDRKPLFVVEDWPDTSCAPVMFSFYSTCCVLKWPQKECKSSSNGTCEPLTLKNVETWQ